MLTTILVLLIVSVTLNLILILLSIISTYQKDMMESRFAMHHRDIAKDVMAARGDFAELKNTILGNKKSLKAKNGKHFRTDRE